MDFTARTNGRGERERAGAKNAYRESCEQEEKLNE
jgi:hypothetical protein